MNLASGQAGYGAREMVMRHPLSLVTSVVVGVDGSAAAAAAAQWAAAEACRRQVLLRIVWAWQKYDQPAPPLSGDPARIPATRVQKALARVLARQHYPRRIACAAPQGVPGEALLGEVGEPGLLVLGVTGATTTPSPGPVNRHCLRCGHGPLVFVAAMPS